MNNNSLLIEELVSNKRTAIQRKIALTNFADNFGWRPSDKITDDLVVGDFINCHLVVEHGLDNAAVISFINEKYNFEELRRDQKRRLLSVSYNNLVDWHIFIDLYNISFLFNRNDIFEPVEKTFLRNNYTAATNEYFIKVAEKKPAPQFQNLDNALIDTISFWKRELAATLDDKVSNKHLSSFFNIILFIRGIEDNNKRLKPNIVDSNLLMEILDKNKNFNFGEIVDRALLKNGVKKKPQWLPSGELLEPFDKLDKDCLYYLFNDFYKNKFAPYEYDFSLISKHALSKIYEHYVSILKFEESPQETLFPPLPKEQINKSSGSFYTPQYVARFFARWLQENLPPKSFRDIKTIDPACGSGIFLRTLLEMQCDPMQEYFSSETVENAFKNISGVDADENACQATFLSLSLLYILLLRKVPQNIDIKSNDFILDYQNNKNKYNESKDVIIANPPFISLNEQSPALKKMLTDFLKDYKGRPDTYLAFLKMALDIVKPGGFILFVLPHSFLISKNAKQLREEVSQKCWIRFLGDLSGIKVFGETSAYVILLILQRKLESNIAAPQSATVLRCSDFVGEALQKSLKGQRISTDYFDIYNVSQEIFKEQDWIILSPEEMSLQNRFKKFDRLEEYLFIREGLITGCDEVFIIPDFKVPKKERSIYKPFLHDRKMEPFKAPSKSDAYVFYPFEGNRKLKADEIEKLFPVTWNYLKDNKEKLEVRLPVRKGDIEWWEPIRPRMPENILRPKIVGPHVVILPRFLIDLEGNYIVSRSPFMYPKDENAGSDMLKYFSAVLNSSVVHWYILNHSHKYGKGYVLLEPKTLKNIPVPDPTTIPANTLNRLIGLVDKLIVESSSVLNLEGEIDNIVADIYNLSQQEKFNIGMELQ